MSHRRRQLFCNNVFDSDSNLWSSRLARTGSPGSEEDDTLAWSRRRKAGRILGGRAGGAVWKGCCVAEEDGGATTCKKCPGGDSLLGTLHS